METDHRIVVVSGQQDPAIAAGYLNEYRLLLADLVIVTMAEPDPGGSACVMRSVVWRAPGPRWWRRVLRPRPAADVSGRTVACITTARPAAHGIIAGAPHGALRGEVVHVSGNLADRAALRDELPKVRADVFVVELKAAAIDVVAEHALSRGIDVVLAANDVVPLQGEAGLDEILLDMAGITV